MQDVLHQIARAGPATRPLGQATPNPSPQPGSVPREESIDPRDAPLQDPIQKKLLGSGIIRNPAGATQWQRHGIECRVATDCDRNAPATANLPIPARRELRSMEWPARLRRCMSPEPLAASARTKQVLTFYASRSLVPPFSVYRHARYPGTTLPVLDIGRDLGAEAPIIQMTLRLFSTGLKPSPRKRDSFHQLEEVATPAPARRPSCVCPPARRVTARACCNQPEESLDAKAVVRNRSRAAAEPARLPCA